MSAEFQGILYPIKSESDGNDNISSNYNII